MTPSEAFEVLVTVVKASEGCVLRAYPDPASPLYKALNRAGLLRKYIAWQAEIPESMRELSGTPWTIGYGETAGVTENMVWTLEFAELRLRARLAQFMLKVYARCPALHGMEPRRAAASTSLAYNIGIGAYGASSVRRCTDRSEFEQAAKSFLLWNKAGGAVMPGLTRRRELESKIYRLLYPQS